MTKHWNVFIKSQIASERHGYADELLTGALCTTEERKAKLTALRAHLAEGAAQAKRGESVAQSLDEILTEFRTGRNGDYASITGRETR